jgi:DNA sulfur modification protein DndB
MAITTRNLVENHRFFEGARIAFNSAANLAPSDKKSLTTIINVYDVLCALFSKIDPKIDQLKLKHYRPSDEKLEYYRIIAESYFEKLANTFPQLNEYFSAKDFPSVASRYRSEDGGNLLFRPVGLLAITETIASLSKKKCSIDEAFALLKKAPLDLSKPPYHNVLWSKSRGMTTKRALARDLLIHILRPDVLTKSRTAVVGRQYAVAIGKVPDEWESALHTLRGAI